MEQMQNAMLTMLQTVTAQKTDAAPETKNSQSDTGDFRKMLEDRTQRVQTDGEPSPTAKEKTVPEAAEGQKPEEKIDTAALQELAAMQMLCADAQTVIEVVPEPVQESVQEPVQELPTDSVLPTVCLEPGSSPEQFVATQYAAVQSLQPEQTFTADPVRSADPDLSAAPEAAPETAPVRMPEQSQAEADTPRQDMSWQNTDAPVKEQPDLLVKTPSDDDGGAEETAAADQTPIFRSVETAPIKVSETASTQASAETQSVEEQVQAKVTEAITQGETRVELQLEPENLGKVTIELTQREDGTLHVALHAENTQTRSLLEKDLFGLQTLLGRSTQQQVQVEVPRQEESQRQDWDGQQQHSQQQNQQRQEQRSSRQSSDDFLNQLRLGLIPLEEAAS